MDYQFFLASKAQLAPTVGVDVSESALHPLGKGHRKIDLTGRRFGRLVVLSDVGRNRKGSVLWQCCCDCGAETIVTSDNLRAGDTVSCGCYHAERQREVPRTHGRAKSHEHYVWLGMRQRCNNPNNPAWPNYGGRGIKVCDRWNTFEAFYADMGEAPSGTSIDRINVNGNYEPENCRWATDAVQARNRRNNRFFEFQGKNQTLKDWADESGIDYWTLHVRLRRGWTFERAITTSVGGSR